MGRRLALIGHPVAGSLSPVLIGAAYGGRHTYELIDEPTYAAAFQRVAAYDGFNVTAPFKENAFRSLDVADPISRELFAVNIVRKKEGKL